MNGLSLAPSNTSMNTRFWTWPIALYLFLGGLGGGTIFMAGIFFFMGMQSIDALTEQLAAAGYSLESYGFTNLQQVIPYTYAGPVGFGIFVGIVCLAFGTLLLIFELGQPKIFYRAFITKTAIIKWGAVLLSIAMICALAVWAIFYWPAEWNLFWYSWTAIGRICMAAAMVASMGLMVYTGVLLSTMKARPFWNTPAVPILFTVSALSTGCALLSLCLEGCPIEFWMFYQFAGDPEAVELVMEQLHLVDTILVIAEIIILMLFVILQYASNEVGARRVATRWLMGDTKILFWGGMIICGLVIPLACYLIGGEIIAGLVAPVLALLGGMLLRFLFVYNNDRRGIPGEQKYFNRLPSSHSPIFDPYWERNGRAF